MTLSALAGPPLDTPPNEDRGQERQKEALKKQVYRKRDVEVSQHSAEVGAAVRLSQEPDEDEYSQNSGACVDGHRAAVQERKRRNTGGLTANYDHTVTEYHAVVLKASAGHVVAESRRPERSGSAVCIFLN